MYQISLKRGRALPLVERQVGTQKCNEKPAFVICTCFIYNKTFNVLVSFLRTIFTVKIPPFCVYHALVHIAHVHIFTRCKQFLGQNATSFRPLVSSSPHNVHCTLPSGITASSSFFVPAGHRYKHHHRGVKAYSHTGTKFTLDTFIKIFNYVYINKTFAL